MDSQTLQDLYKLNPNTWFFAPLGNKSHFESLGLTNTVECDWWDSYQFNFTANSNPFTKSTSTQPCTDAPIISCTPCQHFSSRTAWDRNHTLWSSWGLQVDGASFWFGGDTGYRSVPRNFKGNLKDLPCCPAFKEIGDKLGNVISFFFFYSVYNLACRAF
jgi:N-acyl-phosphatidylethanolamine-hydrolysing phospholipase D